MLLLRTSRRSLRQTFTATILLAAIILLIIYRKKAGPSTLQPSLFEPKLLDDPHITGTCGKHGYSAYNNHQQTGSVRKVFDLFLLSTELDWLEIRLHTLSKHVDYFVIVESAKTFTGLPKPLYLTDNWANFTAFHPQIVHVVVEDQVDSTRTWDHEDFFRNALLYATIPTLTGTDRRANEGDVLIVSDIDEIPKPETVQLLRHCDFPDRLTLRSQFYYYAFQWLHRGEQWPHPQATVYHGIQDTISPKDLRNGEGGPGSLFLRPLRRWWQKADLWNAAWHCSSCFATVGEMQTKMQSFSHTPWNTEANREPGRIVERVRQGLDLFGREGEFYDRVDANMDVPKYVLEHPNRYGYLLDRDGADAAFSDFEP